jgi:hypothetical protein
MRHVFVRIFRWSHKLVAFFTSALKGIFTVIAVLVVVLIPKLLVNPAVVPLAGLLSAVFWFWSANVPIPKDFFVIVPIGGLGNSPELSVLGQRLAWQSQLNTYAAICAGVAALSVSMRGGLIPIIVAAARSARLRARRFSKK